MFLPRIHEIVVQSSLCTLQLLNLPLLLLRVQPGLRNDASRALKLGGINGRLSVGLCPGKRHLPQQLETGR